MNWNELSDTEAARRTVVSGDQEAADKMTSELVGRTVERVIFPDDNLIIMFDDGVAGGIKVAPGPDIIALGRWKRGPK